MNNFKNWIQEAYLEEGIPTSQRQERWQNLVDITQFMWQHGDILTEVELKILVLIPKCNTYTRGIGLL